MTNDTLEFAEALIRRQSVTPDDAGCQDLIAGRLAGAGFACETLPFGDVTNLWARHGNSSPVLCFAGHTDVVPPGQAAWASDPFEPVIRDGILYGRGAADMKCSLAAMTDAAVEYVARHGEHRGSIAFLVTSDEEGRARDGTLRVIDTLTARGDRIDWCVIGEPSSERQLGDVIKIGRRGSLSGILQVNGQQGHVAYPGKANNPIEAFAPVLAGLYDMKLDDGNEFFPPSSFQFVRIESDAGAVNVTPATLQARFNFRYSTVWTHQQLQKHVESVFEGHDIDYELNWHLSGEPYLTKPCPLIDAMRESVGAVTGLHPELSTDGGTSDGRFISPAGADVVEFGAVNETIHKVNERIPVADITAMRDIYGQILERMLG